MRNLCDGEIIRDLVLLHLELKVEDAGGSGSVESVH